MKISFKIGIIIVVSALLISSAYIILFTGATKQTDKKQTQNTEIIDNIAPTITSTTGNIRGDVGNTITISASFSDNVGVTSAKLFYKPSTVLAWSLKSILQSV